jgi:hypothetical protein
VPELKNETKIKNKLHSFFKDEMTGLTGGRYDVLKEQNVAGQRRRF